MEEVRHCKLAKFYKGAKETKQNFKLTFAFAPPLGDEWAGLEKVVPRAMLALGFEKKVGPPPSSELEREAQRLLDQMTE